MAYSCIALTAHVSEKSDTIVRSATQRLGACTASPRSIGRAGSFVQSATDIPMDHARQQNEGQTGVTAGKMEVQLVGRSVQCNAPSSTSCGDRTAGIFPYGGAIMSCASWGKRRTKGRISQRSKGSTDLLAAKGKGIVQPCSARDWWRQGRGKLGR